MGHHHLIDQLPILAVVCHVQHKFFGSRAQLQTVLRKDHLDFQQLVLGRDAAIHDDVRDRFANQHRKQQLRVGNFPSAIAAVQQVLPDDLHPLDMLCRSSVCPDIYVCSCPLGLFGLRGFHATVHTVRCTVQEPCANAFHIGLQRPAEGKPCYKILQGAHQVGKLAARGFVLFQAAAKAGPEIAAFAVFHPCQRDFFAYIAAALAGSGKICKGHTAGSAVDNIIDQDFPVVVPVLVALAYLCRNCQQRLRSAVVQFF